MKNKHVIKELPEGFHESYRFDVMQEPEKVKDLSRLEILILSSLFLLGLWIVPISKLVEGVDFTVVFFRSVLIVLLIGGYITVHERTHILVMRLLGAQQAEVKLDGSLGYTACADYFDRTGYALVLLTPVIFWGMLFAVVLRILPQGWFWSLYPACMMNFSSSSSDYYAAFCLFREKKKVYVKDEGLVLTFYCGEE